MPVNLGDSSAKLGAGTQGLAKEMLPARIEQLFNESKSHRAQRVDRWRKAYRLVHNQAWSPLRESWMASPQVSETYPIISAMAGWMTDMRPGLSVLPFMAPHTPLANTLQQVSRDLETALRAAWTNYEWDAEIEKCLFDAMMYGTGFLKTVWHPHLADGLGDVDLTRVDPLSIYPDPSAHSLEDANYIVEARRLSIQEIDRRFPGFAKKLIGLDDTGYDIDERRDPFNEQGNVPMSNTGAISPVTAPRWGLPGQAREHVFQQDGITVLEAWLREHAEVEDEETGALHLVDQWRVVIIAGGMVLLDRPARDLYGHGEHPYARYVLHDMGDFWGVSLVDHLAPIQIALNRLVASLQSHAELVGNPNLLEPSNSGIPRQRVVNKPGQRLTTNTSATNMIRWLEPPKMSPEVMQLVQYYTGEMERVSGLSAIVRGMQPQGRNAEGVIDSVQEAAFVRVRLALRSLERSLRAIGRKAASMISENYTEPRWVSIVGESGEQTSTTFHARHFYLQDLDQQGPAPLRFTVMVQAGGEQPISREQRQEKAMRLFALGGIDRIALLDAFDYPNRQPIIQRISELEARGAFQPPGARQRAARNT